MKRSNETLIFPRTSAEAFKDATYASPGSYYRPQESRWWPWVIGGIGVAGLLLSMIGGA